MRIDEETASVIGSDTMGKSLGSQLADLRWKRATDEDRAAQADRIRAVTRKRKRTTTPAERSELGRKAAQVRWRRAKAAKRRQPPDDEPLNPWDDV